jgi:hypothetical protein
VWVSFCFFLFIIKFEAQSKIHSSKNRRGREREEKKEKKKNTKRKQEKSRELITQMRQKGGHKTNTELGRNECLRQDAHQKQNKTKQTNEQTTIKTVVR